MKDKVDVDAILMPPPSKRLRGGTVVSPEEVHSKDVVCSLPSTTGEGAAPTWSVSTSGSGEGLFNNFGMTGKISRETSTKMAPEAVASRDIIATRNIVDHTPSMGPDRKTDDNQNGEGESVGTGSLTVVESVDDDGQSIWQSPIKTRFSDIIGHAAAKLRIDEMLLPLALPPSLAKSVLTGVRSLPAALLLYGPPGCGKTQLARAIAGEAQATFISVGPSDILSKFVGESEESVRSLFQHAYKEAKTVASQCSVLFFDEIDALGHARGVGDASSSVNQDSDNCSRRVLAELLIQLTQLSNRACPVAEPYATSQLTSSDESATSRATLYEQRERRSLIPRVIVVAATNRPEDCDPALLRRFPIRVQIGLPSKRDRRKILSKFLGQFEHSITAPHLEQLALVTEGWSGSDLESLTREAAMTPIRECLRSAATMKRRTRKREQQGGDESSQHVKRKSFDADEEAREMLLSTFSSLRPVTLQDFEDAVEFWLGNQQTTVVGEVQQKIRHVHYDSSSSSEGEDD